jgi:hypothetical protein
MIAGLIIYGDVELTCRVAARRSPEKRRDLIISHPRSQGYPLFHEWRARAAERINTAEKAKVYMKDFLESSALHHDTRTQKCHIVAQTPQNEGKAITRDDVVSTGESLRPSRPSSTRASADCRAECPSSRGRLQKNRATSIT